MNRDDLNKFFDEMDKLNLDENVSQNMQDFVDNLSKVSYPLIVEGTKMKLFNKEFAIETLSRLFAGFILYHCDNIDESMAMLKKIENVIVHTDKIINRGIQK